MAWEHSNREPFETIKFGDRLREMDRKTVRERTEQEDKILDRDMPRITSALEATQPFMRDGWTVRTLGWSCEFFSEELYGIKGRMRARLQKWANDVGLQIISTIQTRDGEQEASTIVEETGVDFMYD